jgi:hypothetical protein
LFQIKFVVAERCEIEPVCIHDVNHLPTSDFVAIWQLGSACFGKVGVSRICAFNNHHGVHAQNERVEYARTLALALLTDRRRRENVTSLQNIEQ